MCSLAKLLEDFRSEKLWQPQPAIFQVCAKENLITEDLDMITQLSSQDRGDASVS